MAELDAISETIHSQNEGNPIMDFLKKVFSVTPTAPVAKKGLVMPRDYELKDNRKVSATTGKAINPNRDLVSGKYPSKDIYGIVKAAKRYNLDPYDLLSVSLQETGLNKKGEGLGQIKMSDNEIINDIPTKMDTEEEGVKDEYDMFARAYMSKMKYADRLGIKDPATRMQTYNGLGKITPNTEKGYHGFAMQSIYGVPLPKEGIDMRKNPLYGKRVLDLRDNVLRKDEQLANYIKNIR
jgi:hypothetical protein